MPALKSYWGVMSKITELVTGALAPVIESQGCELVDVEFKKVYGEDNLTVFIYAESGVDLDTCERVHRAIDPVLDELDPTEGAPYILNVSSPGLDRPIVTPRDFERAKGTKVCVGLYAKRDGKKKFEGILVGLVDNCVEIDVGNDKTIKFERQEIAVVKPVIEF